MKKILISAFLLTITFLPARGTVIDSLYRALDLAMDANENYMVEKESRIKSLRRLLEKPGITMEEIYSINSLLYSEFVKYNFDSTLSYINRNQAIANQLGRTDWKIETQFLLSNLLSASGMYNESLEILGAIEPETLSDGQRLDYYSCRQQLFAELGMYTFSEVDAAKYYHLSVLYADSLLNCLDPRSEEYLLLYASKLLGQGLSEQSRAINSQLLSRAKPDSPEYARYAFERAISFRQQGLREMEKEYLIRSAIADIRSSVKDNVSLTLLAIMLYEEKEIDKAYRYINFSLEDAYFYNARLRFLEISRILPLISEAYRVKSNRQRTDLRFYSRVITLLAVFLVLATAFLYFQMRRFARARGELQVANSRLTGLSSELSDANFQLKELNQQLSQSNHLKEEYIGFFLNMCSTYIDKLEDYRKMVKRKVVGGQFEALFTATKSTDLIDMELNELYESFDKIFLHLFPDFLEQFNALLKPEEQLHLRANEKLNAELRIFALIRLGVTDSSKIASFLRYSVNTIYNYRTRIRNRALGSRDAFEDEVRIIGAS